MQLNVSKKHGRVLKLAMRERQTLADAKALCAELSEVTKNETAEAFELAADSITVGLAGLDGLPLVREEVDL
jgi:hypothetical protein